jgi:hypothetical protein
MASRTSAVMIHVSAHRRLTQNRSGTEPATVAGAGVPRRGPSADA